MEPDFGYLIRTYHSHRDWNLDADSLHGNGWRIYSWQAIYTGQPSPTMTYVCVYKQVIHILDSQEFLNAVDNMS